MVKKQESGEEEKQNVSGAELTSNTENEYEDDE